MKAEKHAPMKHMTRNTPKIPNKANAPQPPIKKRRKQGKSTFLSCVQPCASLSLSGNSSTGPVALKGATNRTHQATADGESVGILHAHHAQDTLELLLGSSRRKPYKRHAVSPNIWRRRFVYQGEWLCQRGMGMSLRFAVS